MQPKKLLALQILEILRKYSDEQHKLTQPDIIRLLKREYGAEAERRAVARNIQILEEAGYELVCDETERSGKNGEPEIMRSNWYINRDFTDAELRLLIDGLLFSKYIPYSQCKRLIEKLTALSSVHFNAKMKHVRNLPDNAPDNKQLFYTIDILDEAIEQKKQVTFCYSRYDTDKKQHPRVQENNSKYIYTVNPYQIVATNGRYYLICNTEPHGNVSHYRLDKISDIKIHGGALKPMKNVAGLERGLDLPKHMAEHIYMFTGKSIRVKFRAERSIIDDVFDWLGKNVRISDVTDTHCEVSVVVNEHAIFYWALQYGLYVEVLEPLALRERIKSALAQIGEKYSAENSAAIEKPQDKNPEEMK
jgi:predicted DNA-binding transcriptional regulator YafY